ncbi:MAG: VWA domain-containing protein [Phycisphaerae bacterium]|nr:VWA domain-containing protein [Phycisphaerae bacterium]
MAAEFRCEKCGQMLDVEAEPGSSIKCPHCKKSVTVPAALASLPRPRIVPEGQVARAAQDVTARPDQEAEAEEELIEGDGDDAVMAVMARIMPWVVSLFLHASIALIMAFIVMLAISSEIPSSVVVPSAKLSKNPGGMMNARDRTAKAMTERRRSAARKWSKKESAIITDSGKTAKKISLYAHGGSAGSGSPIQGLAGGAGSPGTSFYGTGGNAHHVVWVIDRSGSMMDSFELVKRETASSIGQLRAIQDFHLILFADGPAIEVDTKRLVPATEKAKLKAVSFLRGKRALRQTDPIPALQRAFAVLRMADRRRPGKLIYLLTDGVFPDNKAVLEEIRKLNPQKEVHINTLLYGNRPPVAVAVMKKIKNENGGQYRYISGDE